MSRRTVLAAAAGAMAGFVLGAAAGIAAYHRRGWIFQTARRVAIMRGWIPKWRIADTPARSPQFTSVASIPYVQGSVDPNSSLRGVIFWDHRLSQPGVDFYSCNDGHRAYLIDASGRLLWRWSLDQALGSRFRQRTNDDTEWWLLPDGEVVVSITDYGTVRLDRESRLEWIYKARTHHDLFVDASENVYAIEHRLRSEPFLSRKIPCLADDIVMLDSRGKAKRRISLTDSLLRSPYGVLLPRLDGVFPPRNLVDGIDVMHTNHVEVFDGRLARLSPLYAAGNLLVSMRDLNSIAILDGGTGDVLWLWGPTNLALQHDPTLLDDGDVLVFDNGRWASQVVEVDPRTNQVVWRYAPGKSLFSSTRGGAQRLANGDTLITDSNAGYATEITPDGKVVWRYANPEVRSGGFRRGIWRMIRFDPSDLRFLDGAAAPRQADGAS